MDKSKMQVFAYDEAMVRTVNVDGEPWFVGKDVAAALGYEKPTDAVRKHVDEEDRGISKMETPSGAQEMPLIDNEDRLESQIAMSGQDRKVIIINESEMYIEEV